MKKLFARGPALALGLAIGLAAGSAVAADAKNPVVANINGSEVHLSTLADLARQLPPELGQPPYEALLEMAVNNQLVYDQAKKDKLENDPEVKAVLKRVETNILTQAWMQKKVTPGVTDATVKARYDEIAKNFVAAEEVRARHILVETEDAAKSIIAELTRGADFAELSKTRSKDQAAARNGGDLGYFRKDDMLPEFSNAAFAMRPGEISKTPVSTRFGFHVIKVEDKRMATLPPYEQAKQGVAQQLADSIREKLVLGLRDKAKIKRFGPDGQPLPEAPAQAPKN
ncbi:Parvulin-like peptidyl-prolyl isomerase [Candidatus Terasakiella magnetica]|nr:Parvulin-like peptidyl-prolyl isomerase [Candidatus Terasakiella magnetica]